jgi:ribonuclease PH
MAEQRRSTGKRGSKNGARGADLSAREAVEQVRREFPRLLGRPIESVLGVEREEDDGWQVTVQVIELERIPRSTDILGAYAVMLDDEGELVGYRRRRRYNRSQADED